MSPQRLACAALRAGLAAAALVVLPSFAQAQGNCQVQGNNARCEFGANATYSLTLMITAASRLTASTSTLVLPSPSATDIENLYSSPGSFTVTIQSNTSWSLATAANAATWSAAGVGARQNKPSSDLQWRIGDVDAFEDYGTSNAPVRSGSATAGTVLTVQVRTKYNWLLDTPGTYSLPLRFVLTAP